MATGPQQIPPQATLGQMIFGSWLSQAICVTAELGLPDALKVGPLSVSDLAKSSGANADALSRVLRALASVGVFRETQDGRYEQTPLSACMRSDVPGSMRAWARMNRAGWQWQMLGNLLFSVRTGNPSSSGAELWEHFAKNKEDGDIFNAAMTGFSASEINAVLTSYDFSSIRKLVDVAGGYGSLLASILKANPEMRGVLFDAPSVIEGAPREIAAYGLGDRCELVAGDFFTSVPPGGDAYMMKHIIHDWDDEHSLKILKNCHAVMEPGAKLLVIDAVIDAGNEPAVGKILDIEMLLIGGRERTEQEFRKLFAAAGFELTRIVRTASPVAVVEGRRL